MNYRQWKKNYKKQYGINPPLSVDKRKQRKQIKKTMKAFDNKKLNEALNNLAKNIKNAAADVMRGIATFGDSIGTGFRNAADIIQPLKIEDCYLDWEVKSVATGYGVYENDLLTGGRQLKLIMRSKRAAEKIVEIIKTDKLEYYKCNYPEKIERLCDIAQ